MLKKISMILAFLILTFNALHSFAISPGAGQAQIQNNMKVMQENQKRMKQMKQTPQVTIKQNTNTMTPKKTPKKQMQNDN
ncbi:MAG TPA: hypothetical protein VLI69_08275 [Gammaproteobacteria bacterium]|nr:hypothetical protein [Gammaproteobacteria bacterium]